MTRTLSRMLLGGLVLVAVLASGLLPATAQAAPAITSPIPESTLPGDTVTFNWTAGGTANIVEWWLYVGTTGVRSNNLFNSSTGTGTSQSVSGLPTDGSTVYVRLYWKVSGQSWAKTDYTYTAFGFSIVNGDFETTTCADPGGGFIAIFPGNPCITGWTVFDKDVHLMGTYWQQASGGIRNLDLDGITGSSGGVEQTIATTPGVTYEVSFDMAGNPEAGPLIKPMMVSADGQSNIFTFDITGKTLSDMGWVTKSFIFTADDTSATLAFKSLTNTTSSTPGWGPTLDNVSIALAPTQQ